MVTADRGASRGRRRSPAVLGAARAGRILVRLGVLDPVHRGSGPAPLPRGQRPRRCGAAPGEPGLYVYRRAQHVRQANPAGRVDLLHPGAQPGDRRDGLRDPLHRRPAGPGVGVGPPGSAAADGADLPGPAAVLAVGLRQGHPDRCRRAQRGPADRTVGRSRPPGPPGHQLGEGVPCPASPTSLRCRRRPRCAGSVVEGARAGARQLPRRRDPGHDPAAARPATGTWPLPSPPARPRTTCACTAWTCCPACGWCSASSRSAPPGCCPPTPNTRPASCPLWPPS